MNPREQRVEQIHLVDRVTINIALELEQDDVRNPVCVPIRAGDAVDEARGRRSEADGVEEEEHGQQARREDRDPQHVRADVGHGF